MTTCGQAAVGCDGVRASLASFAQTGVNPSITTIRELADN